MEKALIGDLPPENLSVIAAIDPFNVGHVQFEVAAGQTLAEILARACPDLVGYRPKIFIDDLEIYEDYYHLVRPKPGNLISIRIAPGKGGGGGKNPLKTVLSIALIAVAPAISSAILGPTLAGTSLGLGTLTYGSLLSAGITAVGNLLINSLVPPAAPKLGNFQAASTATPKQDVSQTYFIQGARNQLRPFATVPEVLGTHRITPPLALQNYNEVSGDKVYIRQGFLLSNGTIAVSQEKFGETLISEYREVTEEDYFTGNGSTRSNLIPDIVTQNDLNITLDNGGSFQGQNTPVETDEVAIDITFPEGLGFIDTAGTKKTQTASYEIRYALAGTTDWVTQSYTEVRAFMATFAISKRFQIPRGEYVFQVKSTSQDLPTNGAADTEARDQGRLRDKMVWTAIRSFKNEAPVTASDVSTKLIRIRGTGQLNGPVDDYNCLASRAIEDWNGSAWISGQYTSNPAAIFRFVLKSPQAKTPLEDSQIDNAAIQAWHDFCAQKGLTYDAYIDYDADRETLLKEIAAAGLATPVIIDNKMSVVVDEAKDTIVQHISQRNSYNYSYQKLFKSQPHALRIPFINKDKDYLQDEMIVYDDGYSFSNATEFEQFDFPGVVSAENNYKLARHRIAEIRLRPDMHKVTMDIENIVATKGDRVRFSHDVALIGLFTGRVAALTIDAGNITGIEVDEQITIEGNKSYACEFRTASGQMLSIAVITNVGVSNSLTFATPVPLASGPAVGDLFTFGESEAVTLDCIVHSVTPQADLTAEIKLVNYAPGIFTAADGTIPDYDNTITLPAEFTQPGAPALIAVQSDEAVQVRNLDGSISSRMVITLQNPNALAVDTIIEMRQVGESDFVPATTVQKDAGRVVVEGLEQNVSYDFNIRYRRIGGAELSNNSVSLPLELRGILFIGEGSPPPDVAGLDITVRGETVRLEWPRVDVIDLKHYELRFSPATSGADWPSGIPLDTAIPAAQTSISVPSAIGTYMIKAVDRQGNYSENETLAVTTVGKLLGLNVVQAIDEHSSWAGTLEGTAVDGGNLKLGSDTLFDSLAGNVDDLGIWDYAGGIATGGVYTFADTQDLGAVYDVVISAALTVAGENLSTQFDDIGLIDDHGLWDGTSPDQYSVELQIRTTQDDPAGSPVVWTNWAPLKPLGEYTARGFEFRLSLSSSAANVTPIVSVASVSIDVPERLESGADIASGTGGHAESFAEAFQATPVIEITADSLATGDYYTITGKSRTGFTIEFFNAAGTSIDRTFSYTALGFGRAG